MAPSEPQKSALSVLIVFGFGLMFGFSCKHPDPKPEPKPPAVADSKPDNGPITLPPIVNDPPISAPDPFKTLPPAPPADDPQPTAKPEQTPLPPLDRPQTHVDAPPANPCESTWLYAYQGQIWEGKQLFRNWGVSFASPWSIGSADDKLIPELDRLKANGVRMVRVLHWGGYQPTYAELDAALPKLDRFIALCRERGIRVWLSLHHRQRFTEDEGPITRFGTISVWNKLWAPRAGGELKGEIGGFFFVDAVLEKFLMAHAETVLLRKNSVTGIRYVDDPTIAIVTIANEKLFTRMPGYALSERTDPNASDYNRTWFRKLDEYAMATGENVNRMDKAQIQRFQAWVGYTTYRRLSDHLRSIGYKGILNASSLFGDTSMDALCELSACQTIDIHCYSASIPNLPDPLSPERQPGERSIDSIIRACHLAGYPVTIGEVAGVIESGGGSRSPSWYDAPRVVGTAAGLNDVSVVTWYAAHSHEIGGAPAKNESYDAFRDPAFVEEWIKGGRLFDVDPLPRGVRGLTLEETFGSGTGKSFVVPIPGTQSWSGPTGDRLELELPGLPWLTPPPEEGMQPKSIKQPVPDPISSPDLGARPFRAPAGVVNPALAA